MSGRERERERERSQASEEQSRGANLKRSRWRSRSLLYLSAACGDRLHGGRPRAILTFNSDTSQPL